MEGDAGMNIRGFIIGIAALVVVWLTFVIGKIEGRSEVMRTTEVRTEYPYYSGVHFGKCAWIEITGIGRVEACPTLPDRRS